MGSFLLISAVVVGAFAVLSATGAWRVLLRPFCINPADMTVSKLGFRVSDPADVACVEGICRAFSGGFNAMISRPSAKAWHGFCDREPVFFRPFAHEGAAMGYRLRSLWRFSPARFEREVVSRGRSFAYLHHVGLGFWAAMRDYRPGRLNRLVGNLDPLHGMLCWDGYGFKFGFFDFDYDAGYTQRFGGVEGYAANVAYQGLGRSLWFRFMDVPEELVSTLRSFGPYAGDGASGLGLASVFAAFDRPQRGLAVVEGMPDEWHSQVLLGMCFGYKARALCDGEYFERVLAKFDAPRRDAVGAGIRKCDAIEASVRQQGGVDGYRRWREELTVWLAENVEYPFAALKHSAPIEADSSVASV